MMNRSKPTKKLILAACNKHDHPLPYLKGVKYADLVSVLQVKGLTQNGSNLMTIHVQPEKPKKIQQPRVPQSSFPPKHSRPSLPPVPKLPPNSHHAEEDDIHEIVPVKSILKA